MSTLDIAAAEQIMKMAELLAETCPASEIQESPVFIRNKESSPRFLVSKKVQAPEVQWYF